VSNIHDVPPEVTFDKFTVIDRRSYSEHLTSFLNSKAEEGYVINLNAEWGAGKTTFLHCWYNELKKDHPVVYFDAWKSDFTHDAMLAITECFHSQLMSPHRANKELLEKLGEKSSQLFKVALPNLLVGYLKNKTGVDSEDTLLGDVTEDLGIEIEQSELAGALKETMKAMLNQKKQLEGLLSFRLALEAFAKDYLSVHTDKIGPIYVLVDELDRCRPSYSIEVIECIKHFFNTPNFVFVLATDTDQLQHSISAIYGSDFNSSAYLSRFFDNSLVLSAPELEEFVKLKLPELAEDTDINKYAIRFISALFQYHKMESLREIEKVFETVSIARTVRKCFKLFPLIILTILKRKYPEYLKQYLYNNALPYQHSYNVNHDMKTHLPISFHQNFELTTQTNVNISYICCASLSNLDKELLTDFINWMTSDVPSHQLQNLFPSFLSIALLNPDEEIAKKDDYISIINFAGHLV
jgi:hypothetical protein